MEEDKMAKVSVIWRGKQLNVEIDQSCNVKQLGQMLQDLTNVKPVTLKLLVPLSEKKSSKLIAPFSDSDSSLSLQDAGIIQGKSIRMMGVFEDEIEEVSENNKRPDLRIIGFDDEEKQLKQRSSNRVQTSLKLPQGPYIFCDFRTLHLPGIELNPPPSEALKRMHMLACDPGIIAIMNKHKWRVGIMTEMAPVGYVGVSPKCILGFNKNKGEEISLRLRTDDLKGFRKYEVIKKTLIHELAHMVHSDHDANFFALNKQLTEEAASLDWTRSKGHTLNGHSISDSYDEEEFSYTPTKPIIANVLGGEVHPSASPRASSVAAAYRRFIDISTGNLDQADPKNEPDLEENKSDPTRSVEPIPEDLDRMVTVSEPDPDDSLTGNNLRLHNKTDRSIDSLENNMAEPTKYDLIPKDVIMEELHSEEKNIMEPGPDESTSVVKYPLEMDLESHAETHRRSEPDPDDGIDNLESEEKNLMEPDPDESTAVAKHPSEIDLESHTEPHMGSEPDPDDRIDNLKSEEIQRLEEPVAEICLRLQKSIQILRSEVNPVEASAVLQTLSKIIRNVIEHPNEGKFRKLRKANPQFQRNVANYTAAMEVLKMVGFSEDVIADELGRAETYMVLKRNDPGLLWLAKSSLEVSMA
ncbi:Ubiquitin and WLM domain-containing metalloprotease [Rhynchospora pubera]|uniref:Ubiquitin and WLM domain-containing metalloprotease n=1 Tax=Rhynchospora pubera TaxID=906938 RepID=A0AAV8BWB3_9POAL|nr:Ubiquitin and WLM domain-containing metalloprotease [Rhynchospora pubera]